MSRGKREAAESGWHRGGDPFSDGAAPGRKKRKTSRGARGTMIVLGSLAAILLLAALLFKGFAAPPDVSDKVPPVENHTEDGTKDPVVPDREDEKEPEPEPIRRKEDFYTFLVMGRDTSSGSTDTIILVSYDVKNQKVSCMSVPRDTCINVSWGVKKINSVYGRREEHGGKIPGMKEQIGKLTGVVPDHYILIDWKAVGELVDALEGVPFYVPYDMHYDDPYQDLHIHQEKGQRVLSGKDAMEVVRWRQNTDGINYGDTVRVQIQQDFMKAVARQCLQLGNITRISEFAEIFSNNVQTDLSMKNILWFAQKAMGLDLENISFMTLPTYEDEFYQYAHAPSYGSYLFAIPEELLAMVNENFNPYDKDLTMDDVEIMVKNRDGSLTVTSGTLADSRLEKGPVKPSRPKKETEKKPAEPKEPPKPEEKPSGETMPDVTIPENKPETKPEVRPENKPETKPENTRPEEKPQEQTDTQVQPDGNPNEEAEDSKPGNEEPMLPPEPTLPPENPGV